MKYRTLAIAAVGTIALGFVAVHAVNADEGWRGHRGGYGGGYGAHHAGGDFMDGHRRGGRHGGHHGGGRAGMGGHFAVFFDLLDVDADNQVSREEALRPANQRFTLIDADKNGFVTADELEAANEENPRRFGQNMLDRLDADGDEQISETEFAVRGRAMFARADANDDGAVDYVEFASLRDDMHKRRGGHTGARGMMGRGPMHGSANDAVGTEDGDGDR